MSDERLSPADVTQLGEHYKGKRSRSNGDRVDDDETGDANVIPFDDVIDVIATPITGSDSSGESGETAPPGYWLVHPPAAPYLNAELFTKAKHRHEVRDLLIHHGGTFERWNATCWPALEDRALRSSIYRFFAEGYVGTPPLAMPFHPTTRKVADIIDALKAHVHISQHLTAPAWLDGNGPLPADELISLANGLLHIPTRSLLEHTPNFYVSWSLPYDFDSHAPTPTRWLQFLGEVWDDDDEAKAALQEWFGYFLSGATSQQKMLMLVGPRRSGKGTIARVLGGLLGSHNVAGPTLSSLSTNFGLAPLIGKPLAIIADARLRSDDSTIVERLLSISGEDLLTIDKKYAEHWTGKLPTRFLLVSNETPRMRDSSGALAPRFIILPFVRSFYGHEDVTLTGQLLEELPAILQWSLEGLKRLTARGYFVQPQSALDLVHELEDLGSPVSAFLRERCTVGPTCSVAAEVLFLAWRDWCNTQGVEHPTNAAVFGRDLRAANPGIKRKRVREDDARSYIYVGVRLGAAPAGARADASATEEPW